MKLKIGSKVYWQWLGRPIYGVIEEIHFNSITKTIKGKNITRNGSKEKPAFLVKSEAGNIALKLISELKVDDRKKGTKKDTPEMFKD